MRRACVASSRECDVTSARVARERTADGRELINVVIGELAADVRRGGKVGQAISNTYGLSRTTAQR